ncbi:spore germination protein GerPE [Cytobacillus sp. Hz8]|uniref:spore germination protein GerPE n=1 Tax=Cytobacillus sp. Hz8 TaxID=3347168 RepID=UPI0035D640FC
MFKRTSVINHIKVDSLLFSSIIEIGDIHTINAFVRAIAVQRDEEIFFEEEGSFSSYPIFQEPIPLPQITEYISIERRNLKPFIHVDKLDVLALSGSSILQVGNSQNVYVESRVEHIRQLLDCK